MCRQTRSWSCVALQHPPALQVSFLRVSTAAFSIAVIPPGRALDKPTLRFAAEVFRNNSMPALVSHLARYSPP